MATKEITVYFHSAWNGYAWRNCAPEIASELQMYIDATGSEPNTNGGRLPFGGAIACMIQNRIGTAVYRYHLRKDSFGRDSIFISLAFIPNDGQLVDFKTILLMDEMRKPENGPNIRPIPKGVDCMASISEDGEPLVEDRKISLHGYEGLQEASSAFHQSKYQLGLLQAKFRLKDESDLSDLSHIEITLDYKIFPEVREVENFSAEFKRKRSSAGFVRKDDPTFINLENSLRKLKKRADKLSYKGLLKYVEANRFLLTADDERAARYRKHGDAIRSLMKSDDVTRMEDAVKSVEEMLSVEDGERGTLIKNVIELAKKVVETSHQQEDRRHDKDIERLKREIGDYSDKVEQKDRLIRSKDEKLRSLMTDMGALRKEYEKLHAKLAKKEVEGDKSIPALSPVCLSLDKGNSERDSNDNPLRSFLTGATIAVVLLGGAVVVFRGCLFKQYSESPHSKDGRSEVCGTGENKDGKSSESPMVVPNGGASNNMNKVESVEGSTKRSNDGDSNAKKDIPVDSSVGKEMINEPYAPTNTITHVANKSKTQKESAR